MIPKRLTLLLFLFISINNSYASLLENGFKIEYDVNYNDMDIGVSKRSLLFVSDKQAIYKAETVPEGFASLIIKETVKEISRSTITRNEIIPLEYTITKNKRGNIEENTIKFDWKNKTVSNSYTKNTESLKTNTHDLLSLQLNIMRDLQKHRKNMQYQIATKKHYRQYALNTEKEETIETSMGDFKTIKLTSKSTEGNSQYTFWCAPTLEFLPIKIQKVNDKGDTFSFTIRTFSMQK